MRSAPLLNLVVLAWAACVGAAAEHEDLGDRAYAERRYSDALIEYRLYLAQVPDAQLVRAKAAMAALRAGDLTSAAEEYVALAIGGGDASTAEAADGLERVVRAAAETRDQAALAAAVNGLRQIAPGRALGRFALELATGESEGPPSEEELVVLFYAAAGAPDARMQDSLMYTYAAGLRRIGRCEEAIPVYESLLRRGLEPTVVERSRNGLGSCALRLGQRALDTNLPLSAEEWFLLAIRRAGTTDYARAAYLGLGDVLFARGEFIGAAVAYENALLGGVPGDSISTVAAAKLNMAQRAGTGIPF
ncbi:MAG: tetratricopeptide repeat protein [Gemmatimonadota bacterium]|nr:MAG: tetratricopeptide repeat protein [Gemmatimonadota bacterium]